VGLPLPFTDEAAGRGAPLIAGADRADVERRGRQVWADCARTGEATPQDVPGFLHTRRLSARADHCVWTPWRRLTPGIGVGPLATGARGRAGTAAPLPRPDQLHQPQPQLPALDALPI
jgi:hypothetical protein